MDTLVIALQIFPFSDVSYLWITREKKKYLSGEGGWRWENQAGGQAGWALTALGPTLLTGQGHSHKVAAIHQCCLCHLTLTQL